MDRFEQKKIKNKRPIKNACYNWLINYIPEPIQKTAGGFKDKVVNLFKINTSKYYGKKLCMGEERNQANQKHKNNLKKT